MDKSRSGTPWGMLCAAVALLGLYAGGYYATVTPVRLPSGTWLGPVEPFPSYRGSQVWMNRAFAPMHWLDRRLRPDIWKP